MDETGKITSHLKLVKNIPLVFGSPAFVLPVFDLPDVQIPDLEFNSRIKSNWARQAACQLYSMKANCSSATLKRRKQLKLEILCSVEKLLINGKRPPTDKDWLEIIVKNNFNYCRMVISAIEKYFPQWMPTQEVWSESIYLKTNITYFEAQKGTWKESVMRLFVENINQRQKKFQDRGWVGEFERFSSETKIRSVKTIAVFLNYIEENFGITNLGGLTQNHIDQYQAISKFDIASLTRLIKMFQRKGVVDKTITVRHVQWSPDIRKLLLPSEVSEITQKLLSNDDPDIIQHILVSLFVLHYGQTASKVCKMNIKKLGVNKNKKWTICFGVVDLDIHPDIAKKLEIWLVARKKILEDRGDPDNEFLFIGQNLLIPLNSDNLSNFLPIENADLKIWRTSAIMNAYRNGINRARVLVDAFGISMPTAMRYQSVFGEVIRAHVTCTS